MNNTNRSVSSQFFNSKLQLFSQFRERTLYKSNVSKQFGILNICDFETKKLLDQGATNMDLR